MAPLCCHSVALALLDLHSADRAGALGLLKYPLGTGCTEVMAAREYLYKAAAVKKRTAAELLDLQII